MLINFAQQMVQSMQDLRIVLQKYLNPADKHLKIISP